MKSAWKAYEKYMKSIEKRHFSKDHLQGIVTLYFISVGSPFLFEGWELLNWSIELPFF